MTKFKQKLMDLKDVDLWKLLKHTNNIEKIEMIKDELVIREIISY